MEKKYLSILNLPYDLLLYYLFFKFLFLWHLFLNEKNWII